MAVAPYVLAQFCARSYQEVHWTAGDVAARLDVVDGVPYITARGTIPDDLLNWIRDFDALLVTDEYLGSVHQGFRDGADALFDAIAKSDIGSVRGVHVFEQCPGFVGHSLGGAMAIDLGGWLLTSGRKITSITTFNAPRAGGSVLKSIVGPHVDQWRHAGDVVSVLPDLPGVYQDMSLPVTLGRELLPLAAHAISNFTDEASYVAP